MTRPLILLLAALLLAAACADDGKKFRKSCGDDTDCAGGVCFEEQCYDACTSKDDCAADEICVWKSTDGGDVSLCVVAADQAGCTSAGECDGLLRLGDCEEAVCGPSQLCQAAPLADCTPGGGDGFVACNEGTVQLTASTPDGLTFDAAGLPTLGVLGLVGEPGDDVSVYLWLKSSPDRIEVAGGDAIVLFLSLPADAPQGGTLTPEGIAIVNGRGTIGVDAEYLEIDDELSTVTWTADSLAAGGKVTGTLDLALSTTCGPARHRPHLTATFEVTLRSVMEVVSAETNCLELLTSAMSFPALTIGKLEVSVDGQPVRLTESQATVSLYPENGTLSLTAYGTDQPTVSVQAYDLVLGAQKATLSVTTDSEGSCSWQAEPEGALTLTAASGSLSEGPVSGTFEGTVPLVEYSDASCTPATHTVSGSFTAALCW